MMRRDPAASSNSSFWCFISYRRADNEKHGRQWATWLHQVIENHPIRRDLIGTVNRHGTTIPDRMCPVFLDKIDLPDESEPENLIFRALEASKFLVVICSPRAVQSEYMDREIRYFQQLGRTDRILTVLIEGEPYAGRDPGKPGHDELNDRECLPKALREELSPGCAPNGETREPITIDLRLGTAQGWTCLEAYRQELKSQGVDARTMSVQTEAYAKKMERMKLKLIAALLGVTPAALG